MILQNVDGLLILCNTAVYFPLDSHIKFPCAKNYSPNRHISSLWYWLMCCIQVKTVKPALKQLQQSIQTITSLHMDDGEKTRVTHCLISQCMLHTIRSREGLDKVLYLPACCLLYCVVLTHRHTDTHMWWNVYFAEPLQHSNPIELFQWLPKEHMCILVYLVCMCVLTFARPDNSILL